MEDLQKQLKSIVKDLFAVSDIEVEVKVAPAGKGADFASNVALRLAGRLKRPAMNIADEIAAKVQDFTIEVVKPGFLNFISSDEYFLHKMRDMRQNFTKAISCDEYLNKTVVCEFSDPNPFKVLHVGHLYTSVVGEAMARLMEFAGARVVRANFGGDVGLHVAKTMYAMKQHKAELAKLQQGNTAGERAEFMARCYVEGTAAYEEDEAAKKEIVKLNKLLYAIVAAGETESKAGSEAELAELYWQGRSWSYDYFEDFYGQIGVKFDKYYPESTVSEKGLETVKRELKKGVYELSDGAVVFKGEPYGLHTRVFINNEGLPTYEAKDVGLIFSKWEDYHFDWSVVITGNDIIDYMKVVLASIKQYEPKLVERTKHLTHGNVRLPGNEKMSSRKGNFLKAVEVLDLVQTALKEKYGSEDRKVALGAAKYAFLKYKVGGDIIFDAKESVSMTGNAGPYLQYACVRARKILDKVGDQSAGQDLLFEIENDFERRLVKKLVEYKAVLGEVVRELAPHKLCSYLYELAQDFSRFYERVKVVGSEQEQQRGELVKLYLQVMEHGLGIMGIEIPEEM